MTRIDTLTVGGSPMRTIVGVPNGAGPHPAVVVMCHIGGIDEFTRSRCEELAKDGFAAAAPDFFHYQPWSDDRDVRRAALKDERMVDDINAAFDHLIATANADPKRLGVLGHCLGGRTALLAAGSVARSRAAAIYYGGRTMNAWGDGPSPFERIKNINGPVIGFFGNLDKSPSPEDVDKIEAEMKRCGVPVEFHRYADAGHAFQDHTSAERYHKESAEDAWKKTRRFFRDTIGTA
jgi:carboxymethylenebutenolidase